MKLREHDVISRKKVINSWHFVFNFKQKVCHFEVRWVIIHIFVRKMLIQFISILLCTKYSSDIVHCTLYRVSNNNSAARNWAQLHAIDASILVHNYRPERTGFNMYAENTQQQLTFLALLPCLNPFMKPGFRYRVLYFGLKLHIQLQVTKYTYFYMLHIQLQVTEYTYFYMLNTFSYRLQSTHIFTCYTFSYRLQSTNIFYMLHIQLQVTE